jgi:hypothetical protein
LGCVYHFPRLHLIDMRPWREALDAKGKPEWANYDPEAALAKEEADRKHDREVAEFQAKLDEDHREAIAKAAQDPPPATVQAYEAAYGRLPQGWPPAG